jgi:hypothetical protein
MTRLEKCVEAVKLAYLSHMPIIWIVTSEKEFADTVAQEFSKEHFGKFTPGETERELDSLKDFQAAESGTVPKISFDWISKPISKENDGFGCDLFNDLEFVVNIQQNIQTAKKSKEQFEFNPLNSCAIIASPYPPYANWLNSYIETIYVPPLEDEEIRHIINSFFASIDIKNINSSFEEQLVINFRGVSERKILVLLSRCMVNELFDDINEEKRTRILSEVRALKRQMLDGFKGLKWIPIDNTSTPAAGLGAITNWLKVRKDIFSDPETKAKEGYDIPKGLLITGVPGTGKSLMAKETAKVLNLPLIAMDLGDLQEGLVGKSEEHMATALRMVDAMAPCVLWIDEIEKAFSGASSGQSDGGVMRRMFGKFLTWMQEKTSFSFVFATSNDISQLPPELFRSERFDEKFYSFMPTAEECAEIFVSNINHHNKKLASENKGTLVLFDGIFSNTKYWIDLLNRVALKSFYNQNSKLADEVQLTSTGQWRAGYKPQKKLFTGADISSFVKLLKFVVLKGRSDSKSLNFGHQGPITKREVDFYIWDILKDFIPYGQSNLNDIAKCFLLLTKNRFKSASQIDDLNSIITFDSFNEETKLIDYKKDRFVEEAYNRVLYRCIVGSINQFGKNNQTLNHNATKQ